MGTVTRDLKGVMKDMVGASEYREKLGVVRLAIGQLRFTPEEMQKNIRFFMEGVKRDFAALSDKVSKEIHEVVSSSSRFSSLPFHFSNFIHTESIIPHSTGLELHQRTRLQFKWGFSESIIPFDAGSLRFLGLSIVLSFPHSICHESAASRDQ